MELWRATAMWYSYVESNKKSKSCSILWRSGETTSVSASQRLTKSECLRAHLRPAPKVLVLSYFYKATKRVGSGGVFTEIRQDVNGKRHHAVQVQPEMPFMIFMWWYKQVEKRMDRKLSRTPPHTFVWWSQRVVFLPNFNPCYFGGPEAKKTPRRKMTVRRWTLPPLKLSRLGPQQLRWPLNGRCLGRCLTPSQKGGVVCGESHGSGGVRGKRDELPIWGDCLTVFWGPWKLEVVVFLEGARLWEGWWYQLPHWFPYCKKLSSDASQMTDLNEMKTCIFRHIFILYTSTYYIHLHLWTYMKKPWISRSCSGPTFVEMWVRSRPI